uniref:Putative secreted protein n=1 Tax=Anopheles darlingi TaxID=43151 RepID=A0A2M4DKD0_ANODA
MTRIFVLVRGLLYIIRSANLYSFQYGGKLQSVPAWEKANSPSSTIIWENPKRHLLIIHISNCSDLFYKNDRA